MTETHRLSWREAVVVYRQPRVIVMLFLGLAAGLPLLLVFSTLSAWLTDAGVSRSAIGFFGWVGITYSIKVIWAPVVDRVPLPGLTALLGRRRSWILLGQCGIAAGLVAMAMIDPGQSLPAIAAAAVLVAFSSATQDIAIDAYRIEAAPDELQAAMAASYILGYRLALLAAGAGALYIADVASWPVAYLSMAALMSVGMITVAVIAEPDHPDTPFRGEFEDAAERYLHRFARLPGGIEPLLVWLSGAVVAPFVEFFRRSGLFALVILAFIGLFRLSDITMGIMANPFYLDLGFSKSEIASVSKLFGFIMTIAGSALGGVLVARYGIMRPLLLGAVMVCLTNLLFATLAEAGASLVLLTVVISADNISGGLSNAVFIGYLASLTNRAYTATQYALFSSLMTLPGKFVSGFSGIVVDGYGYTAFFCYAAAAGIPAIVLVLVLMRAGADRQVPRAPGGAVNGN